MTAGHRAPGLAVAVLAGLAVWGTWSVFVTTRTGRLLEQAALDGAELGQNRLWQVAEPVLDVISVPFIAIVLLATMLLAVLRRRTLLAVQVAVLMGGANLTSQVLKLVLDRPDLSIDSLLRNSLPSGHTTAAASVAVALVFVVPRRFRPAAAVIGALYTAATGVSTLVGQWHRPSDVVAAVLVVLGWGAFAGSLGAHGPLLPGDERPHETTAAAALLLVTGMVSGAGAALAAERSLAGLDAGLDARSELLTAYGGGALAVVAVTCAAFGLLLLLRRAAEPRRAEPRRAEPWSS